ncbi:metallo-beta-lactamase family protein [Kickxella alabastrina]|uniref:metallo-beta-lactamase family protein n=1 Tax=Kickxella alabastrina TaxID=61397 RepID=UPI0022205A43|nr:metallo-beta-lactamase family protein [Kickxella alabastrina]KAI7832001.1 metallo-beta-lactamase family protein [Kickxella alabastrina]
MPRVRELIFLGTGTSGCIPNIPCITSNNPRCKVCKLSMTPEGRKNQRRNTSLLVRVDHPDGRIRNIVIDCGKTFYESAREVFIKHNIETVDAVLLTHGHADAMFGLDDLRQWTMGLNLSIPIYCDKETMGTVGEAFPYLVDTGKATGGGAVPSLAFHVIHDSFSPFQCLGITIQPLRVEHGTYSDGRPFYFTGFRFDDISYVSDCSRIPDETRLLMAGSKLMILDALKWTSHPSHFGYWDALDEVRYFKPERAIFTDFCHRMEHSELERYSEKLKEEENLIVDPAFDGMVVPI